MFRLALCDDDTNYIGMVERNIRNYCKRNNKDLVINTFIDSDMLVDTIEKGVIHDVYILDIKMQDYSGLDIAKKVGQVSSIPCIILLTAHAFYAVEACGMNIFRYVLKEQLEQELPRALNDVFAYLNQLKTDKFYIICNQRKYIKIMQKDIVYIYKYQKNAVFTLTDGKEVSERITLHEVFGKLDNDDMEFLDRGIILNLYHVLNVFNNEVIMDNGYKITSSMAHISLLKKRLNSFWGILI